MIYDLVRLDLREFRFLLRKYTSVDKTLEAAVELTWDGNLRIIRELSYRVMVESSALPGARLSLPDSLKENLTKLSALSRLLLAIITSHIEAVPAEVIYVVAKRINPSLGDAQVRKELSTLIAERAYIEEQAGRYRLADEDLADAIRSAPL